MKKKIYINTKKKQQKNNHFAGRFESGVEAKNGMFSAYIPMQHHHHLHQRNVWNQVFAVLFNSRYMTGVMIVTVVKRPPQHHLT